MIIKGIIKKIVMISEETRNKMKLAHIGKIISEEHKRNISLAKRGKVSPMKGKKLSEATKEKMRLAHQGNKSPMFGKHHNEETKQKISIGLKGTHKNCFWLHTPEVREKARQSMILGYECSEETKRKISDKKRNKKFTEEHKQKIGLAFLGRIHSQETRKKMKEKRLLLVIPFKDTSIEIKLQNALINLNIPFKKHVPLCGQPDIFIDPNICIFADGDYWHNLERAKIRDKFVNETLMSQGYKILRFWENEINNNLENCINQIKSKIIECNN